MCSCLQTPPASCLRYRATIVRERRIRRSGRLTSLAARRRRWQAAPRGSAPRWSSDGRSIAFIGAGDNGQAGIVVANADGTNRAWITEVNGTNAPLPNVGERLAWSPDGRQIAYVSSERGPEPDMDADPIVITRYWWRPASSAGGRFNDNRRLHLYVVDVQTRQVRQLTSGNFYEHSIDWSPDGTQLTFLSNHEPDPDFKNNYDVFLLDVASGAVRQLTHTASNEYRPIWSPDGKAIAVQGLKRQLTSSETNSEDTHVWTIDVSQRAAPRNRGRDRQPAGSAAMGRRRPVDLFHRAVTGQRRLVSDVRRGRTGRARAAGR